MANDFIRQSQLVTTYGPGSMIDLPDYSVMVSGLDEWAYQRREEDRRATFSSETTTITECASVGPLYAPSA